MGAEDRQKIKQEVFCSCVLYCERKRKIKTGEAWEQGYSMHNRVVVIELWHDLELLEPESSINTQYNLLPRQHLSISPLYSEVA